MSTHTHRDRDPVNARRDSSPVPLAAERERTVQALCRHFAGDALTLADFERRIDRAHAARSVPELRELLGDLPALAESGEDEAAVSDAADAEPATPPAERGRAEVPAERRTRFLLAFMGGVERAGPWRPGDHLVVVALMGGAELDFREAKLPPGTTRLTIGCVMGAVDIIVPPELAVDASGLAVMGGFEHKDSGTPTAEDAPRLQITGVAFMGGVGIEMRLPGETARDAKRRRRRERKRLASG